jgi:3-methyladenine DNA glycosylase AlkD
MNAQEYMKGITQIFEDNKDYENAIPMKKYMKNHFDFLGIKSPLRNSLTKTYVKQKGLPNKDIFKAVINKLWALDEREYQYVALFILEKRKEDLTIEDIPFVEKLICTKSWWDTVDGIAPNIVGHIFKKNPSMIQSVINKWLSSNNIWLMRSAILFQLKYKEATDKEILFSIIKRCADSPEFFIRKAIGWSLREYSKTNPKTVIDFINEHELSPLSIREGLKIINKKAGELNE